MICTNIEQSRRLLELGLDPKTADMFWMDTNSVSPCLKLIDDGIFNHRNYLVRFPNTSSLAWSLSALLEVMPITITKDGMEYKLGVFPSGLFSTHCDTSKWTLQYCGRDYSYKSRNKYPILAAITQHDIITAAYEMVCWLLGNDLIKKGGKYE